MSKEIKTLEQAVQELERRKKQDPLATVYSPHKYQKAIHKSRANITLVLGGNRTGKTYSAVAEALLYCLGRSTYAEVPEPPNLVWYIVPTSSTFKDAVEPIINILMPWDRVIRHDKRYNEYKFDNGSILAIKSSDQRQKRLVGANVDFVVADEPMPKVVYEELIARLISTSGRMLKVLTPVSEKMDEWLWVRDELYVPWEIGERTDIDVIHMPVVDEDGKPAVPHLNEEQVQRFIDQYPDPETRAARMYGEFVVRGGLVFAGFNKDVNIVPKFKIPDHWHQWMICDPQYHRFAVLYFAADDKGNYYVTDEYFSTDEVMAIRAERIKAMVGLQDRSVPMYVDYANPQDIQELNYHFNRNNAPIGAVQLPIQKQVEKMVLRVHTMLEASPDRPYHVETGQGDIHGAPRLMLFDSLTSSWTHDGRPVIGSRLVWELQRLTWGKSNKPDKNTAAGGDCTDCLIYGCSIIAVGQVAPVTDSWRDGMTDRDQVVWDAITRQDAAQERGIQNPQ